MRNILTRTIFGAIYLILIVGSIFSGPVVFGILILALLLAGLIEFNSLADKTANNHDKISFIAVGIIIYTSIISYFLNYIDIKHALLIIPAISFLYILELFRKKEHPIENIGLSIFGLFYIVLHLSLLNLLYYPSFSFSHPSKGILLGFFIIIWVNDTFAYLTGSLLGKHKLFERISPNKTWEGTIGGFIFGIIAASIISIFSGELNLYEWIGFATIVIIFGTFGDLIESMFKRSLNVKDSGNIMPGHGGILDRLDSVLIAIPFAILYLLFVLN